MDTASPEQVNLGGVHRRVESSRVHPMLFPEPFSPRQAVNTGIMETPPFLPRSKSELTMSSLPLMKMHSSSSEVSLAASTQTTQSSYATHGREERPASLARSLLTKSSRLLQKRRSTNRMKSMEGLGGESGDWKKRGNQEPSNKRTSRHARLESDDMESQFKPFISGPYNFQHLTHTGPSQAKILQSASHRDLVTEFSAIRAAQAPKPQLKGIRADDITPTFSPEASSFTSPVTTYESPNNSRPTSPAVSPTASEKRRSLRTSQSVDSFTRVSMKSFSSPKPPISPPPRRSSRQAQKSSQALVYNPLTASMESPIIPDIVTPVSANSSPRSYFNIKASTFSPNENIPVDDDSRVDSGGIAQAVTTPDDSAFLFISHQRGTSNAGLADVPEEEEDGARSDARDAKIRELRHARSFPSRSFAKPTDTLQWSTPQLQNDEWQKPADPILPQQNQKEDIPSRYSRRVSQAYNFGQSSWEDDIDYCYEHAMEAEGLGWEEDWAQDEPIDASLPDANPLSGTSSFSNPYLRDLAIGSDNTTSATSSSVSVPGVVTPSDSSMSHQAPRNSDSSSSSILFPLSPSILIPKEYATRITHEENYPQKLNYADSEKASESSFYYVPGLNANVDVHRDYSPRSSGCPISTMPSKESLSTGKTASFTTGSSGSVQHRNSGSVGSIPELMSSPAGKRPMTAMTMASDVDLLPIQRSTSPLPQIDMTLATVHPPTKALPAIPAPDQPSRLRSSSECGGRLLDLALIGAPSQASARLRSGSVASPSSGAPLIKQRGPNHRTSYSLFPATSMTSPR